MGTDDRDDIDDIDDFGDDTTLPCPACGRDVYEDADQCPSCGEWIIPLTGRGRPAWTRIVGLLLIGALLFGVLAGLIRWIR